MAFLEINGFPLSVLNDTFSDEIREVGETTAAFDGTLRKTRQAVKRDMKFETSPLLATEAYAWDCLLRGLGEVWAFDTFYGSKGLGPSLATGCAINGSAGKYSNGARINSGSTLTYPTGLGSKWTAMFWRDDGGGHDHYAIRSDGAKWVNGSRNDGASTGFFSVSVGSVSLTGDGAQRDYDELIVYPFEVPDAWPPIVAAQTSAYPLAPLLSVTGDALDGEGSTASRSMLGFCESSRAIQGTLSGTFYSNLRALSVMLQQV